MNINFSIKIDYPSESDIPMLRHLWQEAFHDNDAFLNLFFKMLAQNHLLPNAF